MPTHNNNDAAMVPTAAGSIQRIGRLTTIGTTTAGAAAGVASLASNVAAIAWHRAQLDR
jgi:hypothetical protein